MAGVGLFSHHWDKSEDCVFDLGLNSDGMWLEQDSTSFALHSKLNELLYVPRSTVYTWV